MSSSIEDAVVSAKRFLINVFKEEGELHNLHLEGVELSDDGQCWLILLGFDQVEKHIGPLPGLMEAMGPRVRRVYKTVEIVREGGDARAIKPAIIDT